MRSSSHPSNEQRKIPYMATEFVLIICLEQPLSDMKGRGAHPLSALLQGAVLSLPPREVKWTAGDTGHGGVFLGRSYICGTCWVMSSLDCSCHGSAPMESSASPSVQSISMHTPPFLAEIHVGLCRPWSSLAQPNHGQEMPKFWLILHPCSKALPSQHRWDPSAPFLVTSLSHLIQLSGGSQGDG